jgi:hypothetical protein
MNLRELCAISMGLARAEGLTPRGIKIEEDVAQRATEVPQIFAADLLERPRENGVLEPDDVAEGNELLYRHSYSLAVTRTRSKQSRLAS